MLELATVKKCEELIASGAAKGEIFGVILRTALDAKAQGRILGHVELMCEIKSDQEAREAHEAHVRGVINSAIRRVKNGDNLDQVLEEYPDLSEGEKKRVKSVLRGLRLLKQ